jgi:hypothetical protein
MNADNKAAFLADFNLKFFPTSISESIVFVFSLGS